MLNLFISSKTRTYNSTINTTKTFLIIIIIITIALLDY